MSTGKLIFWWALLKQKELVMNEIQLLKSTHHPHIIPLLSSSTGSSDTHDLIFPFYSHGDLFHLLIKHGKFNERLTVQVAQQVGKALEYLHLTCGIVHRDVKLENCLVESLNWPESSIHVVLADFGLVLSYYLSFGKEWRYIKICVSLYEKKTGQENHRVSSGTNAMRDIWICCTRNYHLLITLLPQSRLMGPRLSLVYSSGFLPAFLWRARPVYYSKNSNGLFWVPLALVGRDFSKC